MKLEMANREDTFLEKVLFIALLVMISPLIAIGAVYMFIRDSISRG